MIKEAETRRKRLETGREGRNDSTKDYEEGGKQKPSKKR